MTIEKEKYADAVKAIENNDMETIKEYFYNLKDTDLTHEDNEFIDFILFHALRKKNISIFKVLPPTLELESYEFILNDAIKYNQVEIVKILLEYYNTNIDKRTKLSDIINKKIPNPEMYNLLDDFLVKYQLW